MGIDFLTMKPANGPPDSWITKLCSNSVRSVLRSINDMFLFISTLSNGCSIIYSMMICIIWLSNSEYVVFCLLFFSLRNTRESTRLQPFIFCVIVLDVDVTCVLYLNDSHFLCSLFLYLNFFFYL